MNAVIRVENISKKYILSHQKPESYLALRDILTHKVSGVFRKIFYPQENNDLCSEDALNEEFYALRDISFEVNLGDRIGIIGRNGAGKSTLLKILSRITEPTFGKISLKGRVASLLEVGTGFHPELTGRENILLNGAVLGMSKGDINRKFDQIVDFSEVEKFLDTPVKHYSSGMYVRLAFAVAAHLEPDILIVDEVLAVGDAQFQKKCLGKMEEAGKEGRTVLFVSHNMGLISSLCEKAILLEAGKIVKQGVCSEVINYYYSNGVISPAIINFKDKKAKIGNDYAELMQAYIFDGKGNASSEIYSSDPVRIGMVYRVLMSRKHSNIYPYPSFHIYSSDGACVFYTSPSNCQLFEPEPGKYLAECIIPEGFLNVGTYYVGLGFADCSSGINIHFFEKSGLCFHIMDFVSKNIIENDRNGFSGSIPGYIKPKLKWELKCLD